MKTDEKRCPICREALGRNNRSGYCPGHYTLSDAHKASAKRYRDKYRMKRVERIPRECLQCWRPFVAKGRFTRTCQDCKENNRKKGLEAGRIYSMGNRILFLS